MRPENKIYHRGEKESSGCRREIKKTVEERLSKEEKLSQV
jgi:hypothetical protein